MPDIIFKLIKLLIKVIKLLNFYIFQNFILSNLSIFNLIQAFSQLCNTFRHM